MGRLLFLGRRRVGNEHVTLSPDGTDVSRLGRVPLDELSQAHDLHVDAAVGGLMVWSVSKREQPVAPQRSTRLLHQGQQHGELARGQHKILAIAQETLRVDQQGEFTEPDGIGSLLRPDVPSQQALAPDHGLDAGQ